MAVRKRFRKEEKADFQPGALIDWLNSTHWLPARVTGPMSTDDLGYPFFPCAVQKTTRTISSGQYVRGYPGAIRLRDI